MYRMTFFSFCCTHPKNQLSYRNCPFKRSARSQPPTQPGSNKTT